MQSVYAMTQSHSEDLLKEEKFLKQSIRKMFDLYVLSLQLMVEVQKLSKDKLEISKNKFLATSEDLQPNTKFVDNKFINKLAESTSLQIHIEAYKLDDWELNDEYVKLIHEKLIKSDLFRRYLASDDDSSKEDKEFVLNFYKEIIASDVKLADYYEDANISWSDDLAFVNTWVVRTLSQLSTSRDFVLGKLYKNQDDQDFVSDLFRKVMLHHHQYEENIRSNTPNWESDRIADLDMIIIKMGICEFLEFSSVPVRVTINEYIELAKDYSTSKSGYFVNGVLDRLSREYLDNKRIVKVGRGLL